MPISHEGLVLSFVEIVENLKTPRTEAQLGSGLIESNVLAMAPDPLHWCAESIRLLWIEVIERQARHLLGRVGSRLRQIVGRW